MFALDAFLVVQSLVASAFLGWVMRGHQDPCSIRACCSSFMLVAELAWVRRSVFVVAMFWFELFADCLIYAFMLCVVFVLKFCAYVYLCV